MSLFTGHTNNYLTTDKYDTKVSGGLDMKFLPLRNIPMPTKSFDAISEDYFQRKIITQSVLYKYLGFNTFNKKHLPTYNHGNNRGSDVLHSDNYNEYSMLYLSDISFDNDSTNYNIKLHFHARLIYKDKSIIEKKLTTGNGYGMIPREQYSIELSRGTSIIPVRWIKLGLEYKLSDIAKGKPLSDLRFIIILVSQSYGVASGQEFVLHCSVKGA